MKSTTFVLNSLILASAALAADFGTYPSVPKSYTINGFADPVYDALPECAKECVSYENPTICPTFDSGCFCVMGNWNALVAECLVANCVGDEIVQATSAITSMCNRVGANTWAMPASYSTALSEAAIKQVEVTTTNEGEIATTEDAPASTTEESVSTGAGEESVAETTAAETTSNAPSGTAEESSAEETTTSATGSSSEVASSSPSVETANIAVRGAVGAIGFVAALPFLL